LEASEATARGELARAVAGPGPWQVKDCLLRYCIFGDVHGNLEALEAVLADAAKQDIERHVCVGDIVGYGADPRACVARVLEVTSQIVAGNHDCATVGRTDLEYFNVFAKEAVLWTQAQLSAEEMAFLRGLPLTLSVDGMTIVHATVHQPELFGYIESELSARLSFEALEDDIAFLGHSHVPVIFFYEQQEEEIWYSQDREVPMGDFSKAIVNVGSVGQPRDENPRAAYAIYDTEQQKVFIRRVDYDVEKAKQKILNAGLPEVLATRLAIGR
jgi:diadenosine tetraphosphatase ApaH/serine/threonine PP2A family protein phosphatase